MVHQDVLQRLLHFDSPESIFSGHHFRDRADNCVLTLPQTWSQANEKPAIGWDQSNVTIRKTIETAGYVTEEETFWPRNVGGRGADEM